MAIFNRYDDIDMGLYEYVLNANYGYDDFCALNYMGKKISYSEFVSNVAKVKEAFIKSGVGPGDVVSILYLTTPETIYSMYALDSIGATVNFLNPIEPESIKETLEEEKPKLVICYDSFYPMVKGVVDDSKIIITNPTDSLPSSIKKMDKIKNILLKKRPDLPKDIFKWNDFVTKGIITENSHQKNNNVNVNGIHIGTGGSSGIPKQVQLSSELLNNVVKQHHLMNNSPAFNIDFKRGETLLDVIPPHLGYGICDIHLALCFGLTLAIEPDPNPKKFVTSVLKHKPNFILAGPVHWKQYNSYTGCRKTPYIKTAVSGGEPLEKKIEDDTNNNLRKRGSKTCVHEGVGLTEIAGVATYNSDPKDAKYTVGRPLPEYVVGIFKVDQDEDKYDNTHLKDNICLLYYTKDENGEFNITTNGILGKDNFGEICYHLPISVDGYTGKYSKENHDIIKIHEDGKTWVHTGDIGYVREDKNLVVVDRIKRVFNRNGFKVYPNNLENIAQNSGLIDDCIVVPRKSIDEGEANVPIMYATLKSQENKDDFIEYCNNKIVGNNSIYQYIFLDELPRTGAGKKSYKYIQSYDSTMYPLAGEEIYKEKTIEDAICLKKTKRLN